MWTWLVVAAVAVLVVLAVVALVMWRKVWRLERERRASLALQEAEGNRKIAEHRRKLNKDIQVIVGALLKDELTHTEAALRLCYALEMLGVDGRSHPQYAVFFTLREKTAHIPVLAAWRALDASTQRKFDQERLNAEMAVTDELLAAARELTNANFD